MTNKQQLAKPLNRTEVLEAGIFLGMGFTLGGALILATTALLFIAATKLIDYVAANPLALTIFGRTFS